MKKLIAILVFTSLLTVQSYANGWATAGKVLTGVGAVLVLDRIINPPQPTVVYQPSVVVQQSPVVVQQPVVVQPQPVVYVQPAVPVVYYSSPQVIVYPGCPTPVYRYHYHHHHHR